MGGDFFDLYLFEAAVALVQALLYVPLQDFLSRRVLLDELGRVLRAVERQTQGYFVGVFDCFSLCVGEGDIQAEWGRRYKKFLSR